MKMKNKIPIFIMVLFLASVISLPSTYAAAGPQYGGVYRTVMAEPRSLDPHIETYAQTSAVTNNTNNRLIRWNKDM
ncbi:MAG: hypothetical protein ACYC56_13360, partial [Candidatus Aquicultor sp.]